MVGLTLLAFFFVHVCGSIEFALVACGGAAYVFDRVLMGIVFLGELFPAVLSLFLGNLIRSNAELLVSREGYATIPSMDIYSILIRTVTWLSLVCLPKILFLAKGDIFG